MLVAANTTELLGPDKAQHCRAATGRQRRAPRRAAGEGRGGEAGDWGWGGGGLGAGKINMLTVNWDCCYFLSHFDWWVG